MNLKKINITLLKKIRNLYPHKSTYPICTYFSSLFSKIQLGLHAARHVPFINSHTFTLKDREIAL